MACLPQDLLELLAEAEKQLEASNDAVVFHTVKEQELDDAIDAEEEALEFAFESLEEANATAAIAIDAIKDHFGL